MQYAIAQLIPLCKLGLISVEDVARFVNAGMNSLNTLVDSKKEVIDDDD